MALALPVLILLPLLLAQAGSPAEIIEHHLISKLLEELARTHSGKPELSPHPVILTSEQRQAIARLAATIDPTLPPAEIEKIEQKLAVAAVAPFDPKRSLTGPALTPEQRAGLQQVAASLKTEPNERARKP